MIFQWNFEVNANGNVDTLDFAQFKSKYLYVECDKLSIVRTKTLVSIDNKNVSRATRRCVRLNIYWIRHTNNNTTRQQQPKRNQSLSGSRTTVHSDKNALELNEPKFMTENHFQLKRWYALGHVWCCCWHTVNDDYFVPTGMELYIEMWNFVEYVWRAGEITQESCSSCLLIQNIVRVCVRARSPVRWFGVVILYIHRQVTQLNCL